MPTATPFNNLITFSRGSNATVTGSNGLIQWAPNNLLLQSESFDAAAWTKANTSVLPNTEVAPDGTTTADRVTYAAQFSNLTQVVSLPPGTYTASYWVKADTGTNPLFISYFNGVFETGTSITPTASWARHSYTFTSATTVTQIVLAQDRAASGFGRAFVWGAQLELGSTATTYNPTTVKNLLGFSEAFDNAAWTKTRASIVTGAQANPVNGLFNAQKLMEDTTASNTHFVAASVTTTAAPNTLSVYAKAAERSWIYIRIADSGNIARVVWFNIGSGAVGTTGSGITASIQNIGNGWYRCTATIAAAFAGGQNPRIGLASADNVETYTGDGNSGVYIYGAQLSDSASLDPYVPTPGAAPSSTAFYGPRFDFDPVTRAPRGLLVEEQRTNLQTYSEDFANAAWTKSNTGTLLRNQVSPTGAANSATTLVADNAGGVGQVFVNQVFSTTSGTAYTMSAYLKQGTQRYAAINIFNGFTNASLWLDLQAGTFGVLAGSGATGSISNVGNGWYRCVVSATANATVGNAAFRLAIAENTTDVNYNTPRNGTSSILIFGAQVEAGAFATSYIPTVASTVTRSADVATVTGQNFAQWYNQPEGSFVMGYQTIETGLFATTGVALGFDNNLGKSLIYIGGGGDQAASFDGATIVSSGVDTTGNVAKVASAYSASGRAISANGVAAVTGTVAAGYSSASLLNIARITGGNVLNSRIQSINYVPARAADFQLQAITTQPIVDYFFLQTATGDQLVDGNGDELYSLPIFG